MCCRASIHRLSLERIQAIQLLNQQAIHQARVLQAVDIHQRMLLEVIHPRLEWATHPALRLLAIPRASCLVATRRPAIHRLSLVATPLLSSLAILDRTLRQVGLMAVNMLLADTSLSISLLGSCFCTLC